MNGLQPDKVCKLGMARTWQKVRPLAKLTVLDNVMVGALVPHQLAQDGPRDRHGAAQGGAAGRTRPTSWPAASPSASGRSWRWRACWPPSPTLLLLDEVMGGLNPAESEEIIQLILDIKKRGITQMVIEHDMKAIMRISDRIVVLNSGEKLAEGIPAGDRQQPGGDHRLSGRGHV